MRNISAIPPFVRLLLGSRVFADLGLFTLRLLTGYLIALSKVRQQYLLRSHLIGSGASTTHDVSNPRKTHLILGFTGAPLLLPLPTSNMLSL